MPSTSKITLQPGRSPGYETRCFALTRRLTKGCWMYLHIASSSLFAFNNGQKSTSLQLVSCSALQKFREGQSCSECMDGLTRAAIAEQPLPAGPFPGAELLWQSARQRDGQAHPGLHSILAICSRATRRLAGHPA